MINIFEELSWSQFKQLNEVRTLPLNEQVNQYNQYIYDLIQARQNWIAYQNKGIQSTTTVSTSSEYPDFDGGPFSVVYYALRYADGVSNLDWPTGLLNQTSINNIATITATAIPNTGYLNIPSPIASWVDLSIGDILPDLIGGIGYKSFVTHRGIPQPGVVQATTGFGPQWTSGDLEYIFTFDKSNGEIVDINTFIVP